MNEPLICVIVPVYKVERYLDRCVESIVDQSYHNLEIILVDDGSPDRCGAMCDAWAEKDCRIRVIHKPNGGLSDARNAGVRVCRGEYVVFADSDDYLADQMVERLYRAAVAAGTKMAVCGINCVTDAGVPTGESDGSPVTDEILAAEEVLRRFYQHHGWFYIVAWNRLYHRSLLGDKPFPVGKWHEDEFTAARFVWEAGRVASVAYPGCNYVTRREGSIMGAGDDPRHLDVLEALVERYHFYQCIGQTALLHETRARVLKALEAYYWGGKSKDPRYDEKMKWLRRAYGCLTGLPLKERLKWMVFRISPELERRLVQCRKHE